MANIDMFLNIIQEQQFYASVSRADINGKFQEEWTDCFESKCQRRIEDKYELRYCKLQCYMTACNNAITKLNAERSNCTKAADPAKCIKSLQKAVTEYQTKIKNTRLAQTKVMAKIADLRRKTRGV